MIYHAHYDELEVIEHEGEAFVGTVVGIERNAPIPFYTLKNRFSDKTQIVSEAEVQAKLESSRGKRVIALTGRDRVGKTRTALEFAKRYGDKVRVLSFATPLREIARRAGVSVDHNEDWGDAYGVGRSEVDLDLAETGEEIGALERERRINDYIKQHYPHARQTLINLSEAIKALDPTFFVRLMVNSVDEAFGEGVEVVVIDDMRFEVEFEYLKNMLDELAVYQLFATDDLEDQASDSWVEESWGEESWVGFVPMRGTQDSAIENGADWIVEHEQLASSTTAGNALVADLNGEPEWKTPAILSSHGIDLIPDESLADFTAIDLAEYAERPKGILQEALFGAPESEPEKSSQDLYDEIIEKIDEVSKYVERGQATRGMHQGATEQVLDGREELDRINEKVGYLTVNMGVVPTYYMYDRVVREVLLDE